jgi:A/G-specific adenine glycosylase
VLLDEIPALKKKCRVIDLEVSKLYRHVLSHQTIDARFITASFETIPILKEPELKLYSRKKIAELPKPVLITRFLDDYKWSED